MLTKEQKDTLDDFLDALVNSDTVAVILTGYGSKDYTTKTIYEIVAELCRGKDW